MRTAFVHAGILASLLWGLLRTDLDANAATAACEGIEQDVPATTVAAALPVGLLYRRAFLGDEALVGPTSTLTDVTVRDALGRPGGGVVLEAAAGAELRFAPAAAVPFGAATRARLDLVAHAAGRIELEFVDATRGTRLYRSLELGEGEHLIEVPLTDLRYDRGVIPRMDRATRWGVRFVDGGTFELRAFELWRDDDADANAHEIDALRDDFDDPTRVTTWRRGPFVLLSDAPKLDPEPVFDALEQMHDNVRALLPSMPTTDQAIPLLVFADAPEYRRFWRRFSARHGADIGPRDEDEGLTWLGVATASWSPEWTVVRPTYVHEAHHALLERSYGLSAGRSWVLEGLAILEQLAISEQDLSPVYRRGLRRRGAAAELHALTDGSPIDTRQYWQAAMMAQWLVSDPGRRAALDAALVEMSARGDTDLRPLAMRYFGQEFTGLSVEFWSWAWLTHGA